MKIVVWVRTQFVGFHRYANAPDDVAFLRNWHRHIFYVKVGVEVTDANREIEFFQFKRYLDRFIEGRFIGSGSYFEKSCEMLAMEFIKEVSKDYMVTFCEVSEDNENGATVYYTPEPRVAEVYPAGDWQINPVIHEDEKKETKFEQAWKHIERDFKVPTGFKEGEFPPTRLTVEPIKKLDLSKMNSRNRPFIGIDAEGPNRGKKLLFIPGSTEPEVARIAIDRAGEDNEVWGVYYGAGNDLVFRPDTWAVITTFYETGVITVECEKVTSEIYGFTEGTYTTVVSRTPGDQPADYIKTFDAQRDMVVWLSADGKNIKYETSINDPLFSEDKYL